MSRSGYGGRNEAEERSICHEGEHEGFGSRSHNTQVLVVRRDYHGVRAGLLDTLRPRRQLHIADRCYDVVCHPSDMAEACIAPT